MLLMVILSLDSECVNGPCVSHCDVISLCSEGGGVLPARGALPPPPWRYHGFLDFDIRLTRNQTQPISPSINNTATTTNVMEMSAIALCALLEGNMMTSSNGNMFRVTGPFARGIHRSPVNSPHKGQWRGALMVFFYLHLNKGSVNHQDAGDLRRHRIHSDVTVMARVIVI